MLDAMESFADGTEVLVSEGARTVEFRFNVAALTAENSHHEGPGLHPLLAHHVQQLARPLSGKVRHQDIKMTLFDPRTVLSVDLDHGGTIMLVWDEENAKKIEVL